jgi:sugar/nucleoside kinase (ribokinase family)
VVIKRGDKGAYGAAESQQPVAAPTSPVTPIDTTGAGDAFAAAFIPRWITTRDLQESMAAGNALARECVTIIGARPSVNPQ